MRIHLCLLLLICLGWLPLANANPNPSSSIELTEVKITGATVFTAAALNAALPDWRGRQLYLEDLVAMADAITQLYQQHGYVNSGAVLTEQALSDGRLLIQVREGQLDRIDIESANRLRPGWVTRYLRRQLSEPLQLENLRQSFASLEDQPAVGRVRGELVPGAGQGESVLRLSVREADTFTVAAGVNNYRTPSVGSDQAFISLRHNNLLGYTDALSLQLQHSQGADAWSGTYEMPIGFLNSRLRLLYAKGETLVIEAPFDVLELESAVDTVGVELATVWGMPHGRVWRTLVGYEQKESLTSLLQAPFDFSFASVNGVSKAHVGTFDLAFSWQGRERALKLRAGLRKGLDRGDATIIPGLPDARFTVYRLQMEALQRLTRQERPWLLSMRLNLQDTNDTLPAFERFALGGQATVRGYRENELLKDSALSARAQLSTPLMREAQDKVRVHVFVDYGLGENSGRQANTDVRGELISIGLGLELQWAGFRGRLEVGKPLRDLSRRGDTLQDRGIHLELRYEM